MKMWRKALGSLHLLLLLLLLHHEWESLGGGGSVIIIAAAAAGAPSSSSSSSSSSPQLLSLNPPPLSTSFYANSCPSLHSLVSSSVAARLQQDRSAIGPLLRIFFHDCFVRGCDASVLIKSTANNTAERDAVPNQTLREFGLINAIKVQVENACPGIVSCADIVALAAKEAVVQSGGPAWEVEMGRRDGRTSVAAEAALPSSLSSAQDLILIFASKSLSIRDLVTLSGAHTIGGAHCFQAARRFYGFNSPTGIDPTLNSTYARTLRSICHQPINSHLRVPLDASTPSVFDNTYYQNLLFNKGLFTSDSSLMNDAMTKPIVQEYAVDQASFFSHFVTSMIAMGRIEVLTGSQGEIRRHCEAIN